MNEWPTGWFRDSESGPPQGPAGPGGLWEVPGAPARPGGPPGAANDPTVRLPPRATGSAGGSASARASWPEQPPLSSGAGGQSYSPPQPAGSAGGGGRRTGFPAGRRRMPRIRRVLAIAAAVVGVLLVVAGGTYFYLSSKLAHGNVLTDYRGRPAASAGQNWLITGSDSRQGLTRNQMRRLSTGFDVSGHRSDTIMLLHIPANGGRPLLISLPRDSYVPIPGHGDNKINAAFSFGGPKLLAETVQNVTGLRIDHYMEIGFGGLVSVVDAVGGVRMCLPHSLRDRAAGLHLKKGCQTLDGAQALGYVRTRHQFASQDLQRIQDQRIFLAALLRKLTSPGTLLNPFSAVPAAFSAAGSLTVDNGTQLYQLVSVAFALRNPVTTTVPIADANYSTPAGDAVRWNRAQALELFNDLRTGRRVPARLLTGSHLAG